MAHKPVDRGFDKPYLKEQHDAMRWLAQQGLPPEEIRTFRWGNVDDAGKEISVEVPIKRFKIDLKKWTSEGKNARLDSSGGMRNGQPRRELTEAEDGVKEFKIDLKGTPSESFFLKSKIYCTYVFLKERPRRDNKKGLTMRELQKLYKERGKDSLYSLSEIRKIVKNYSGKTINLLTFLDGFGTIRISKANIQNPKIEMGQTKEIRLSEMTLNN